MAIYHMSAKVVKSDKSARSKADYISREGDYKERHEDELSHIEHNVPDWAKDDPLSFWSMADQNERKNGLRAREIVAALPLELSKEQRHALAHDFAVAVAQLGQEKGGTLAYTLAVHDSPTNPHFHLLFSERVVTDKQLDQKAFFGRSNPKITSFQGKSTERKDALSKVREAWSELQNHHLKELGHDSQVDHRSNADRGLEERPEQHIGPHNYRAVVDGQEPQKIKDIAMRTPEELTPQAWTEKYGTSKELQATEAKVSELEIHKEVLENELRKAIKENNIATRELPQKPELDEALVTKKHMRSSQKYRTAQANYAQAKKELKAHQITATQEPFAVLAIRFIFNLLKKSVGLNPSLSEYQIQQLQREEMRAKEARTKKHFESTSKEVKKQVKDAIIDEIAKTPESTKEFDEAHKELDEIRDKMDSIKATLGQIGEELDPSLSSLKRLKLGLELDEEEAWNLNFKRERDADNAL